MIQTDGIYRAKFDNGHESKWLKNLKSILDNCRYSNIWNQNQLFNRTWLIKSLKQKLLDQFQQNWNSTCNDSSKGVTYNLFTNLHFGCQLYVDSRLNNYKKQILARFRTANHKLPIETGRWEGIERINRKCLLCKKEINKIP